MLLLSLDRDGTMKRLRMRFSRMILAALLVVAALTLAACGGGEPPTATPLPATAIPTASPTPMAEPTTPPTAEPATTEASGETATAEAKPEVEASQAESPLAAPDSPLAAPPSPLAPPSPAPTPVISGEEGGLAGQIVVVRPTGDVAVSGLVIGLAEVILGDDGLPKASGYEASAAPKATTDDYGRFVFNNLKPGLYTLVLDAVVTQYQLDEAETGDTILVEVKADEVVELGELRYPSLPIPGFQ